MSTEKYLINRLKHEYGIKVKRIKMASSGTYYIPYKRFGRDCCIFEEPFGDKLYSSLEDIFKDIEETLSQNDCEEEVDKEKPLKPSYEYDGFADGGPVYYAVCCNCGREFDLDSEQYSYCPDCGQKLDWSDVE